jgi:hypothetical protein
MCLDGHVLAIDEVDSMDWILVTIALLLSLTCTAFFLELIPYPVGAALLAVLFIFRVLKKRHSRRT